MKAEHVKTLKTTEEGSSHPGKEGLGSPETRGTTSRAEEKSRADSGKGAKSSKMPMLVAGKKSNGKSRLKDGVHFCD
jgi:hypothetical protein